MNMYFGESQKLIRALFSMCRKLAPCILFIDEVDIFLSSRGHDIQEANAQMKSEFLQLWTVCCPKTWTTSTESWWWVPRNAR